MGQRRQLRQLGGIIDDQCFPLDGAGEEGRQLPVPTHFAILGAEVSDADIPLPGHHVCMFETDEGLEHLDQTVQHLLQGLGIGQRSHATQQGLRLLAIFGLAFPTTHQLHQRGLQLVPEGFQFGITYHLVSSAIYQLSRKITLDTIRLPCASSPWGKRPCSPKVNGVMKGISPSRV